jgi:AcrR family transcriptional regulator
MPMSRSKDPRRQAALLAAGRQVLSVKGLDRMTVDDVTSEAGVAKGTFYLYFRSKADLVVALRQEFANRLIETLKDAAAQDTPIDWPDAAHRILEAAVDGYLSAAPGYRAVLGQRASDPEDEGWTDEIIGLFADFLARGGRRRGIRRRGSRDRRRPALLRPGRHLPSRPGHRDAESGTARRRSRCGSGRNHPELNTDLTRQHGSLVV